MGLVIVWIKGLVKSWPYKYLLSPIVGALFIAGPTSYIACMKSVDTTGQWFSSHTTLAIICCSWPVISLVLIRIFKETCKTKLALDQKVMMTLFSVIDHVVGSKSERFTQFAVQYKPGDKPDIFANITMPEVQTKMLVEAVYKLFEIIKPHHNIHFRVALARMGEKHLANISYVQPADLPCRGVLSEYQNNRCGFSIAKKTQKIHIVSDIAKELKKGGKRQFSAVTGGSEDGSIIVYPIFHHGTKEVIYCLSVLCSEAGYFHPKNKGTYCDIMDKFAKRIELEHSLQLIKERHDHVHAIA